MLPGSRDDLGKLYLGATSPCLSATSGCRDGCPAVHSVRPSRCPSPSGEPHRSWARHLSRIGTPEVCHGRATERSPNVITRPRGPDTRRVPGHCGPRAPTAGAVLPGSASATDAEHQSDSEPVPREPQTGPAMLVGPMPTVTMAEVHRTRFRIGVPACDLLCVCVDYKYPRPVDSSCG